MAEPARLGMGAPLPLTWEAVATPGTLAQKSFGGYDWQRPGLRQRLVVAPVWLLEVGREAAFGSRQERLLWWGRLLLEGG